MRLSKILKQYKFYRFSYNRAIQIKGQTMKNLTLFSLVAASMLFTACGEKTEKAVEETSEVLQEAVKADTASALESAKNSLSNAAEATKAKAAQMAEDAKIEAEKMADAAAAKTAELKASAEESMAAASDELKETADKISVATTETITSISAPAAYVKCKGCHGADGKTVALGKSAVIAGQDKSALITSMNEYKAGTKNVAGMGMLMKGQVATMSDEDIEAVAEYLSQL